MAKTYLGIKLQDLGVYQTLDPKDKIVIVKDNDEGVMALQEFFFYVQSNLDMGNYYTSTQVNNLFMAKTDTYTRQVMDTKFALVEKTYTRLQSDSRYALLTDTYTKEESDSKYAINDNVYTKEKVYTKDEALFAFALKSEIPILPDLSPYSTTAKGDLRWAMRTDVWSKTEADARFANINNYYTKTETDGKYAVAANTYTKAEADTKFMDTTEAYSKDYINLNMYTKTQVYTKAESNNLYPLKGDVYTVAAVNDQFAAKSWVYSRGDADNTFAPKLTTYTKTEVNSLIDAKVSGLNTNVASSYYTKTDADAKFALIGSSYTKVQSDAKYALASDVLTATQTASKYYNKTETDAFFEANVSNADAKFALKTEALKDITVNPTTLTFTRVDNTIASVSIPTWNQSTTGNAATATKLATPRSIAMSGAVTAAGVNFDGSANISLTATALDATKLTGIVPNANLNGYYTSISFKGINNGNNVQFSNELTGASSGRVVLGIVQAKSSAVTQSGAIVIQTSIPALSSSVMKSITVKGMVYSQNGIIDLTISSYNTSTGVNYQPAKINNGGLEIPVKIAANASGKLVYILGEVSDTWAYPHIAVTEALLSYGVTDAYTTGWSISYLTDLTGFTNITASLTDTVTALRSKWENIVNTPTTVAGYGITDAYTKTEVYNKTEADARYTPTGTAYSKAEADGKYELKGVAYDKSTSDTRYLPTTPSLVNITNGGVAGATLNLNTTISNSTQLSGLYWNRGTQLISELRPLWSTTNNTWLFGLNLNAGTTSTDTTAAASRVLEIYPNYIWHKTYGRMDSYFRLVSDSYTKAEVDTAINNVKAAYLTTANAASTYTTITNYNTLVTRVANEEKARQDLNTYLDTYFAKMSNYWDRDASDAKYYSKSSPTLDINTTADAWTEGGLKLNTTFATGEGPSIQWNANNVTKSAIASSNVSGDMNFYIQQNNNSMGLTFQVSKTTLWHKSFGDLNIYFRKASDSYTTTEVDNAITNALTNYYDKATSDTKYAAAANTYTSAQIDAMVVKVNETRDVTSSGLNRINKIAINRTSNYASGISWYSETYNTWQTYMAQAGTANQGIKGNITPVAGTLVTSWALRNVIEPSAGYGWTFESMANGGTAPTIVAEIRSIDGASRFAGAMTVNNDFTANKVNTSVFNTASIFSFLNGSASQKILTGGVLASNTYADQSLIPANGIYSRGNIQTAGNFVGTAVTQAVADNSTQIATTAFTQSLTSGVISKAVTGGAVTLTDIEAANQVINLTGTLTSNLAITFPATFKRMWVVYNNTTGAFKVTAGLSAGPSVNIVQGKRTVIYADATGMYEAMNDFESIELTGTPTSTTPALNDSSTNIATTAFVLNQIANDAYTKADVYTKTEADSKYTPVGTAYTKSESDDKYALIGASYSKAEADLRYTTDTQNVIGITVSPTSIVLTKKDGAPLTATIPVWNQNTTGNAGTATKLQTIRSIGMTGDGSWGVNFDGASNVTAAFTLANSGVTAGTYPKVTVDAKGRVTAGTALVAADIPALDMGKITTGVLPIAQGGTGASNAAAARSNLGLGDIATVSIGMNAGQVRLNDQIPEISAAWNSTADGDKFGTQIPVNGNLLTPVKYGNVGSIDYGAGLARRYIFNSKEYLVGWALGLGKGLLYRTYAQRDTATDKWTQYTAMVLDTVNSSTTNVQFNTLKLTTPSTHTAAPNTFIDTDGAIKKTSFTFGSAASKNVGTNTDNVMLVGSFGIGATVAPLYNDSVEPGDLPGGFFRYADNSTKKPPMMSMYDVFGIRIPRHVNGAGGTFWLPYTTSDTKRIVYQAHLPGMTEQQYHVFYTDQNTPNEDVTVKSLTIKNLSGNSDNAPNLYYHTDGKLYKTNQSALLKTQADSYYAPIDRSYLISSDTSTLPALLPNKMPNKAGGFYFADGSASGFGMGNSDVIWLSTYQDSSTGGVNALAFSKETNNPTIKHLTGGFAAGAWAQVKTLAYTDSNITGNAASATKLQTARKINGIAFDGSSDITITDSTKLPLSGGTLTGLLVANSGINASTLNAVNMGINSVDPASGNGISLYGGVFTTANQLPTYGISHSGTANFGTHGAVTGDWATYFTISGTATRGWIFKNGNTSAGNVASISATGIYTGGANLTGTPTAPTPAVATNNTQIATTEYVVNRVAQDSPTKTGLGASGTWGISVTGNAASANTSTKLTTARTINGVAFDGTSNISVPGQTTVIASDLRVIKPTDLTKRGVSFYFSSKTGLDTGTTSGGGYGDVIALSSYGDSSGGRVNALFITKSISQAIYHYTGNIDGTTWSGVRELAYTDNTALTGIPTAPTAAVGTATTQIATTAFVNNKIANDAPTKTGGGASGTWSIGVTGNAGTATQLATARTISLSGDVTGSVSFDGSANVNIVATVADDSHNHSISTVNGLQSTLDSIAKTVTGTIPATPGWYRIATSPLDIARNSGRFELDWSQNGLHGQVIFNAAIMFGDAASVSMTQVLYSRYGSLGITKARIVYNTTYTDKYAYLEIYSDSTSTLTVNSTGLGLMGWSLLSPSTVGSIPTGYTSREMIFRQGVITEGQLSSTIETGTAPLVVTSTTAVPNLNADMVDNFHASQTAAANNIAVRDGSGNLAGNILGNAATATKLQTARTIAMSGAVTGTATSFDGTSNISINATSVDATKLAGAVPNANMTGIYDGISIRLNKTSSIYTEGSGGKVSGILLSEYRSSGSVTGAIVFTSAHAPNSTMRRIRIQGFLSNGNNCIVDVQVSSYTYSATNINNYGKISLGNRDIDVRFGTDAAGLFCIILGDASTVWSYPHLAITEAQFSHVLPSVDMCNNWSSGIVTDLSTFTAITPYFQTSYSTVQVDWTKIPNSPTSVSGYGITDAYTKTEVNDNFVKLNESRAVTINKLLLNKSSVASAAINWYKESQNTWQTYLATANSTGNGVSGNITAPTGTLVTSWALRNIATNLSGYGWTFESMAGDGTAPTVVAEIRATDGSAKFNGSITSGADITAGSGIVNASTLKSSTAVKILNGAAAQGTQMGSLLVSSAYTDETNVPTNGIWSKGNIQTAASFVGNTITQVDGTSNTALASTAFVQNAVGGYLSKTGLTGGTVALTDAEVSNAVMSFAGALTSNLVVTVPTTNRRLWSVINGTTGAFTLTIKTPSGSGVTVAQGKRNLVYTDGTNVLDAFNDFESIALTGVPTAPTAATGTSDTQIATTAFVNAEIANDAPTKTGGGASGTWGISVTGNAATATTATTTTGNAGTATKLATARAINGVNFDGTAAITIADSTKLPLTGGSITGSLSVSATTTSAVVNAANIGISTTDGTAGNGVSLYGGAVTAAGTLPSYGLSFSSTATFGTHGAVTGDWATYFIVNGATSRGWIFKNASTGTANVASISLTGLFTGGADPVLGTKDRTLATTWFVQETVGGYLAKTGLTGGTITLTDAEVSNAVIALTGTLTSNLVVVVPTTNKRVWSFFNNTTGAFTVTVKTPSGTGVTIAQGKRNSVYTDGTNVLDAFNDFESIALTGVPTAPTATVGDSSTQIATTAFVNAEIANDAPSKTGTGASGTWGISISGNAATATTATTTSGNAATATKLATARTFTLSGAVTGSASFDGAANPTIATTLAASPALTGTPTAPTATDGTNTTQIATTAFVQNTVGGYLSKTGLTGGTVALTDVEASNATLYFAGALTSNLVITVPTTNKRLWAVWNNTTGAFTLTIKTPSGAGVTVAQGKRNLVYSDGSTIQDAFNDFESIALTGTPTAPTAAVGNSTTQIATTAFVNAEIANDAPTKTGSGASGTWAIAVTGNAATATKLATARTINGVSFDGTGNITVADSTKLPLAGGTITGALTVPDQSIISADGLAVNTGTANTKIRYALDYSPATAAAWINFSYMYDSTAGTNVITVKSSYNISNITRTGLGIYKVEFLRAFENEHFVMAGFARDDDGGADVIIGQQSNQVFTSTTAVFSVVSGTARSMPTSPVCTVLFFGNRYGGAWLL